MFGNYVVDEMNKIDGKNAKTVERKRMMRFNRILGLKQKFADPALVGPTRKSKD